MMTMTDDARQLLAVYFKMVEAKSEDASEQTPMMSQTETTAREQGQKLLMIAQVLPIRSTADSVKRWMLDGPLGLKVYSFACCLLVCTAAVLQMIGGLLNPFIMINQVFI